MSIGSLYQYFPRLDALLAALAEREAERLLVALTQAFMGAMQGTANDMARALVRALVGRYSEDLELHRVLRLEVPFAWECEFIGPRLDQAAEALKAWIVTHPHLCCRHDDVDLAVRSCESAVHSMVVYQPERVTDPVFEAQLVDLVLRFLVADSQPATALANGSGAQV